MNAAQSLHSIRPATPARHGLTSAGPTHAGSVPRGSTPTGSSAHGAARVAPTPRAPRPAVVSSGSSPRKTRRSVLFVVLLGIVFLAGGGALGAQMLPDSRNHRLNPAFLSIGSRGMFELGLDTQVTGYNDAFALGDVFTETLVIDFDALSDSVGESGLRLGSSASAGAHVVGHLFGFGLGGYARSESLGEVTIPDSFFELLAEGNELDKPYSGSGGVFLRSFVETGAYASGEFSDYTVGLKLARFMPLAYGEADDGFEYELETTENGITATAGIDVPVFSAFDLEAIEGGDSVDMSDAMNNAGLKMDLGVVRRDAQDRAKWGAAFTDVSIVPATATGEFRVTGSAGFEMDGAAQKQIDDEDPFDLSQADPSAEFSGDADEQIRMPMGVSGFYRFEFPWVDLIPHGQVIFDERSGILNPGVTVAGNRFPANLLYLGVERNRLAWRAGAGLRIPLYVFEMDLRVQSTSRRIGGIFGPEGLSGGLNVRLGF